MRRGVDTVDTVDVAAVALMLGGYCRCTRQRNLQLVRQRVVMCQWKEA